MPARRTIVNQFTFNRGKDLSGSDLTRDLNSASEFQNCRITKTLSIINRTGSKICSPDGPFLGLHTHSFSDSVTGATNEEIIGISQNLFKRVDKTFTVTYSGSASSATVTFTLNPSTLTYQLVLTDDGVTVLTSDVGTGLEVSPQTVTNLQTAINAVTNFGATFTGASGTPAAFLPLMLSEDVSGSPHTAIFTYNEWSQVTSTVTNPFGTSYAARGNDNYEPPSFTNLYGNTYIATGFEYLQKYDGNNVYRAGLPQSPIPTVATTTGSLTGTYTYIATYKQIDNRGRVYFGVVSLPSGSVSPSGQGVNVTVTNILAATGFNTDSGKLAANTGVTPSGGAVTLVIQAGHTFHAGDTAYFLNRHVSVAAYKGYVVASTTGTTLVLTTGDTITTLNNDIASNQLIIQLWRNKNGGTFYYLQGEYANNSLGATQVITDTTADGSLGALFDYPVKAPDVLNVKPKYVCEHQGVLCVSGDIGNPNTIFFEDAEMREGFPLASNNFDIPSTFKGGISGIGSDQEHLIIGFDYSIYYTAGVLNSDSFRVEKVVEGGVGVASHASMRFVTFQENTGPLGIRQGLIFLSTFGFKMIVSGTTIIDIGAKTNPTFTNPQYNSSQALKLKRATSTVFAKDQLYICFVPAESGSGTGRYATDFSTVQVYDYYHNAWMDDTLLNMAGGVAVYNNNLWWLSKRSDTGLGVTGNLYTHHATNTANDYADHALSIAFRIATQWDAAGDPNLDKLFLRVRVFNLLRDILGAAYAVTMQAEKNFIQDVAATTSQMTFGAATSSGWGLFPWGLGPWGTSQLLQRTTKLSSGKAKSMRFVFTSSIIHQKIALTGWSYEVVGAFAKEMKR